MAAVNAALLSRWDSRCRDFDPGHGALQVLALAFQNRNEARAGRTVNRWRRVSAFPGPVRVRLKGMETKEIVFEHAERQVTIVCTWS